MRKANTARASVSAAFFAAILLSSCPSSPSPPEEPFPLPQLEATAPEPLPEPAAPAFDPTAVTAEVKSATFVDIRALIDSLNRIIRKKEYDSWLSHLTEEYIAYYSDPAILAKYSEYPIIKRTGVTLKTLKDYFIYVVYPSRQNDKVDDIEFVRENLIKAITASPKGDRNILYMLEKHGDAWKIGIGR